MRIIWSPLFIEKLHGILGVIFEDDALTAGHILDEIDHTVGLLIHFPQIGKIMADQDDLNLREIIIQRKYRLVYQVSEIEIQLMSIRHTRQND